MLHLRKCNLRSQRHLSHSPTSSRKKPIVLSFSDPEMDPEDNSNVGALLVQQQIIQRNIRCSLAYLYVLSFNPFRSTRLDRLHRVAWEAGKSLPKHIEDNLCASEVQYYKLYLQCLDELNKEYS